MLSLQYYPSLAGKTGGTRIEKYRPLVMPPRFVRQAVANDTAQSLVLFVLLGAYLLAAVAARVPSSNKHIPLIRTLRIGFRIRLRLPQLFIVNYSLFIKKARYCVLFFYSSLPPVRPMRFFS